ncbi:restriction endonuclease subunit S [Dysosmobacter sp.]|uniref:restriction endonuclease subunit S n=1 Tax=Dysosmobacter sp. TaxID=2591382 RepID=UPI003AB76870
MEYKRLGDIATYINGYPFKPEDRGLTGLPIIRIQDLTGNSYDLGFYNGNYPERIEINDGDVLISWSASLGVYIWNKGKALLNQHIFKVAFDKCEVNKQFFVYAVQYKLQEMGAKAHGATMKHIVKKDFDNTAIPFPALEEQEKIAQTMNRISRIISDRQQQLQKLDELVKARFIELFGDPVINPKGFPCYTVGEVIDFQGGSQPDKKYFEYEASPDNIRLIQIRDYKSDKYITYIPKTMSKRFCTADDIMIGRYGPPIFQILKGIEGSFNVALMKATPKIGNKEFVRHFLKQDCLLEYLEGLSKRTAGQDGIQMDKLKAYPFPYPPIELQEQFAAFVEQADKSKVTIQKALDEAQLLFDSLMQKYFG